MKKDDFKVFADYFVAFEHLDEYVKESLKRKHFIEAVVLIHTTIEIYLSGMLDDALNIDKRKIIRDFRFINLARISFLLDLIDKSTFEGLLEINKIRNSFAHQNINFNMTEKQFEKKCKKWLKLNKKIFDLAVKMHEKSNF